ncbi:MAG TPA: hypothetical protein VEI50_02595 [Nitrospiraceae bacterium]|nr:hypothetical protein [Nitrospiraceae bacterium]
MHYRSNRSVPWLLIVGFAIAVMLNDVAFAQITTSFDLQGIVNTPGTYDDTTLQSPAFAPLTTQTDTFTAGGTPQTNTFTGVPLYNFLTSSAGGGGIVTTPGVKNDFLRDFAVVTGSDGYRVVVSEGEIDPNFGHEPDLIADQVNGGSLGSNGDFRTTSPSDVAGGRYVSNVANISIFSATVYSTIQGTGGGTTTSFVIQGQVANSGTVMNLATLNALPQTTVTVGANTFTGVSLYTLLTSSGGGGGILTNPSIKNDLLGKYVVATGSDGNKAVIALGEIAPNFGGSNGLQQDLIATSENGSPLTTDGFARLIVPNDTNAGRWVSYLVGLEVLSAPPAIVPAPAAGILFATGLGGLVWRRVRHIV